MSKSWAMTSQDNVFDLRSILKSVRLRIDVLEAAASSRKPDRELQKRIKEVKIEEAVIREKLEISENVQ